MRYLIIFLLIFLLSVFTISGQESRGESRQIQWEGIKTYSYNEEEKLRMLFFRNAVYDENYGKLPLYFERILPKQINVEVHAEIIKPEFVNLSQDEAALLDGNMILSDEFRAEVIKAEIRKKQYLDIYVIPIRKTRSGYQKLLRFDLKITYGKPLKSQQKSLKDYADHSVLSQGEWIRISVKNDGIYKLTFADLKDNGLQSNSYPIQKVGLFNNGAGMLPEANAEFRYDDLQENAIIVADNNNNSLFDQGDYILFYGQSPHVWEYDNSDEKFHHQINYYSDHTYYFFTPDQASGKRIITENYAAVSNVTVNSFDDYDYHELELVNLIKSGRRWYGESFDIITQYDFSFSFPNLILSEPVYMKSSLLARSTAISEFYVNVDGNAYTVSIAAITNSYNTDYARSSNDTIAFLPSTSNLNVSISYNKPTSSALGWLNYLEMNVRKNLSFTSGQMSFRDTRSVGSGNISSFTISNTNTNLKVWDISNSLNIKELQGTYTGNVFSFVAETDSLRKFIAYDGTSYRNPEIIEVVENQDLHASAQVDYVIVSYPDFFTYAEELAQHHRDVNNLDVLVVEPQHIYNEFSSGAQDISAIRDFMKMFYDRAGSNTALMPRYLLLFGDGSYDPKSRIADNTNFIPTFHSKNSLQPTASYVTDDFFGLLDDSEGNGSNGNLDIGIGRFPVVSREEAGIMVDKVKRYSSIEYTEDAPGACSSVISVANMADWRNLICFIADDEDGNLHLDQSDQMATYVDTSYTDYNIDKIFFDAYSQESTPGGQRYYEVNEAINDRVAKGALIVNYTGHGGEVGWAHERVLEISDINQWCNYNNLPVFITATCEFSRFDDPERVSAGELVILNENGGAICLFTTTRLAFAHSNFSLNMNFYQNAFAKINGEFPRFGDLIRMAKTPSNLNIRNFVLLGDPAVQMVYPEYSVVTSEINGSSLATTDTISALEKVTVKGYIADDQGNPINDFDGIIYPSVFDKYSTITTLGNDPASYPTNFKLQSNLLYKGKASVTNGEFSFSFIVPKDIAYQYGEGKISYYAHNDVTDANGSYEGFIVGGSYDNAALDEAGPNIELYLNDESFVFGGITNESPVLLAYLSDSSGINTIGNGIGHDVVAILDENTDHTYVLNDYYEADLNSYTSGIVRYPFAKLAEGLHRLSLKVWDVYNNSSEVYTEFVVANSAEVALQHVMNYPNPFTTRTSFYFEHNQPGTDLEVVIQIFTISGKLVKTIREVILTDGFQVDQIDWDGRDDYGDVIGKGVYIYRLKVRNSGGSWAEETEKLVILK